MKDQFLACGFSSTEYEVLLYLLKRGALSASLVARGLGLKRQTVYSALESLERRKLVTRAKKPQGVIFTPIAARDVPLVMARDANSEFEKVIGALALIRPRIETLQRSEVVRLGDDQLAVTHLDLNSDYYNLLVDKYLVKSDICAVWNPNLWLDNELSKKNVARFLRLSTKRKNRVRDIVHPGPMTTWYQGKISNPHHEVRTIDMKGTGLSDVFVAADVVVVSLSSTKQDCALEIKNRHFADFMRWYFESLWERLP